MICKINVFNEQDQWGGGGGGGGGGGQVNIFERLENIADLWVVKN